MKISIITATYNRADTIRDTIESILSQTYQDWEHVVIDGASKDNTLDILEEYKECYKGRLKFLSEPDKGIYDAMNKGLAMATGDVIGILNSDDFYHDNHVLSDIVDKIGKYDAVYGDIVHVDQNDKTQEKRLYSSKGFKRWKMKMGLMPAHPSFYCKSTIYTNFGNYAIDIPVAADFDCLLRFLYIHKINALYIPRIFVKMRAGGASSNGIKSYLQGLQDRKQIFARNRIYSNYLLLGCGYALKLWDLIIFKLTQFKQL